jgi:pSer/pThr/pTyr-binding forkhead associated (FHA) protein
LKKNKNKDILKGSLIYNEKEFPIDKVVFRVGRERNNDLIIEDMEMSRNHFEIIRDNYVYTIKDLNSKNGTLLNINKIQSTILKNNDSIKAGNSVFLFKVSNA